MEYINDYWNACSMFSKISKFTFIWKSEALIAIFIALQLAKNNAIRMRAKLK